MYDIVWIIMTAQIPIAMYTICMYVLFDFLGTFVPGSHSRNF